MDFQSTALPTELPSRDGADHVALWDVHYATMYWESKSISRTRVEALSDGDSQRMHSNSLVVLKRIRMIADLSR